MDKNSIEAFGEYVFDDAQMRNRLPEDVYNNLRNIIERGGELDLKNADIIAHEMKEWAIEQGCTHYTHWFHPLTGVSAEKHDSFLSPSKEGDFIIKFGGKELIKGEPDASSFPSGGLRATFEARGYTAWDCTSPVFVRKDAAGATLCIPTAFYSYNGEALDQKIPLLRSMEAVNKQIIRLLRLLGNTTVKKVTPSIGIEQEYFLVDAAKYKQRKDLVYTGHTLFGHMPPKGQEMDDHYFGMIRQKIASFMRDVNVELWKMGVPAKTQHNEVAPAQHELAPIFEQANVAIDHNQIIMHTLRRKASAHGMKCILHEKPFAGVNGSGKHNNWSLVTDDGKNLLDPGKTPHENTQFLLLLSCIIKAVDRHAGLLRESAADAGNDLRLGADEAPPAVISIFLGEQLEDVVSQLIETGEATHSIKGGTLHTGIKTLPDFHKDATDRNRTSPFAFTGNKFEFRMVGAKNSVASSTIVLNTIVAESLSDACDILEKSDDINNAVHNVTVNNFIEHQRVLFAGNGYSEEWIKEAERRGLPNLPTTVDAIPELTKPENVSMYEKFNVFSANELIAREEMKYENYAKTLNIDAKVMVDIAGKHIIPSVIKYTKVLAEDIISLREAGFEEYSVQSEMLERINRHLKDAYAALKDLVIKDDKANTLKQGKEQAIYYRDYVVPAMENLRSPIDKLEVLVDKDFWSMPSYGDLLFDV
ncbi:MAG: glutamine synthetase III [Candidatus Alectryocaccobium sp.]|nr:glutamine synthetase III [Lachnospiraceae bacterium]MDY6222312.1 glutamine synthetase III [Candidatus Alectryocaccobium sp.]